jgi:threonyl-tRNA synthetase
MLIVGEKEETDSKVSFRKQGSGDQGSVSVVDFIKMIDDEVKSLI